MTTTVTDVTDEARKNRRMERYRALRWLWANPQFAPDAEPNARGFIPPVTKVSQCKRHSILPSGNVEVRVTPTSAGPRAGFKGLLSCGSVWACPVCSNKISTARADEISNGLNTWANQEGKMAFLTLTMRHDKNQSLKELWAALSHAWARVTSGREWTQTQNKHGFELADKKRIPWIRAVEATHGKNGWHLHIHVILFYRGNLDLDLLALDMFTRWTAALTRHGLRGPLFHKGGCDIRPITATEGMGDYFTKMTYSSAGMEAVRGQQKQGKSENRTPFQILENIVLNIDNADDSTLQRSAVRDIGLWQEWERESKGKLQLTWSKGLRNFLALGTELTDSELAEMDNSTDETVITHIIGQTDWPKYRRNLSNLLDEAEAIYQRDLLPAFELVPDFSNQWRYSWFADRVEKSSRDF